MIYPDIATLEQLEAKHPEYIDMAQTYEKIEDLFVGGPRIEAKKRSYIPKRPGEEAEIYRLRLEKFVYTPILSGAIRKLVAKTISASYNVAGVSGDAVAKLESDFWSYFREKTDGKSRKERQLLHELMLILVKFGKCYVVVDKPATAIAPRNRTEEEQLGLKPYAVLYEPSIAFDWHKTDTLQWVKFRQLITQSDPLGKRELIARWTFFDTESIAVYEAKVEQTKKGLKLLNPVGKSNNGVAIKTQLNHGSYGLPVVLCELPSQMWVCKDAYLKAFQYLWIENSFTDTATIAGYIQRLWKPTVQADSVDVTTMESEAYVAQVKSGNPHILVGDSFQFVEASGSSLATIRQHVLDPIRDEIHSIVSLAGVSASSSKGVVEQSGLSKGYDQAELNNAAKDYGALLANIYQDILRKVAIAAGYEPTKISVTGFDSFDLDTLDTLLEQTKGIMAYAAQLPTLALQLWFSKLVGQMHKAASAVQMEEMQKQLDAIDYTVKPSQDGSPTV